MRITVVLDDELVTQAQKHTGVREKSRLIREAPTALIERAREVRGAAKLVMLGVISPWFCRVPSPCVRGSRAAFVWRGAAAPRNDRG
ncbi:MAG: type II toxin-antitoxin system VapB family antitoxin [Terriglobales bacterium]